MCDGQVGGRVSHSCMYACTHTGDSMIALGCSSEPGRLLLVQLCRLMGSHEKKEPESRCTEDDRVSKRATAAVGGFPPESAPPLTIPIKPSANCSDSVANSTNLLYRSFISLSFYFFNPPNHLPFSNTYIYSHIHTQCLPEGLCPSD